MPEVFLSSHTTGLEPHRDSVIQELEECGYDVFDYRRESGIGSILRDRLIEYIDGSQVMVLLLGEKYGHTYDAADNLSWTEFEWAHARTRPRYKILPFVHMEHFAPSQDKCESSQHQFIARVTDEGRMVYGQFQLAPESAENGKPTYATGRVVLKAVASHYHKMFVDMEKEFPIAFGTIAAEFLRSIAVLAVLYLLFLGAVFWATRHGLGEAELKLLVMLGFAAFMVILLAKLCAMLRRRLTSVIGQSRDILHGKS